MIAHGDATSAARGQQVRTILASAGSALAGQDQAGTAKTGTAKAGKAAAVSGQPKPRLVRVTSGGLVYSGELRQAEFTGSVRAETVDGTIRANQATIYLQDEAKGRTGSGSGATSALATPALAGQVERMVANGQIEIEQTGRRATGGHLVYTANDEADSGTANGGISSGGLFVLTGDGKVQPRMVDAVRGTITGAALQFHSGDDRVVVTNVEPEAATGAGAAQRVHSETRVGKDLSKDAGKGKGK